MMRCLALGAATLLLAVTATAQVRAFTDTFDTENGGLSFLGYTAFANWTTTGSVDLIATPDYGITCAGGLGSSCVDLAGATGPGGIEMRDLFTLAAGDVLRFTFDVSGSQRRASPDVLFLDFLTAGDFRASYTGSFGTATDLMIFDGSGLGVSIDGTAGWTTLFLELTALEAGMVGFGLSTTSDDDIGPLVDNTRVDVIPEPATVVLVATGLALMAGLARRRRPAG